MGLIRQNSIRSDSDVELFMNAIAFNWLIGGTDAHAKNYSMLIGSGGRARMAPFYDLASALPYPDLQFQKLKLAMKIGGEYRIRDIGMRQWEKLWTTTRYDAEHGRIWLTEWINKLPALLSDTRKRIEQSGLKHPVIERLEAAISERTKPLNRQV